MTLNASLRRSGEVRDGGLRDDVSCGEVRERLMSRRLMSSTLWRFRQILYIGRVVDIPVVRGWRLLLSREACVFLKPVTSDMSWFVDESTAVIVQEKLALKSLDVEKQ